MRWDRFSSFPVVMAAPVWLLAGLSLLLWWRLMPPLALPPLTPVAPPSVPLHPDAVAAWLGAVEPVLPPSLASRYELRGVIVQAGGGVALLSVDGRPARPYPVGALIEDDLVLRSVSRGRAELQGARGEGIAIILDMPTAP